MRFLLISLLLFWTHMLTAPESLAHRVNIFAYVDVDRIRVECSFNRGSKVKYGRIEVRDAVSDELLLTGSTDELGGFSFIPPDKARLAGHDLRIQVDAGEGHVNHWLVRVEDLPLPAEGDMAGARTPAMPEQPESADLRLDRRTLEDIINTTMERQLAPVKTLLLEQVDRDPGLKDIIGGIGWIIGLAGLAAYYRQRRRGV